MIAAGFPGINKPCEKSPDVLPLGVQIIAPVGTY